MKSMSLKEIKIIYISKQSKNHKNAHLYEYLILPKFYHSIKRQFSLSTVIKQISKKRCFTLKLKIIRKTKFLLVEALKTY